MSKSSVEVPVTAVPYNMTDRVSRGRSRAITNTFDSLPSTGSNVVRAATVSREFDTASARGVATPHETHFAVDVPQLAITIVALKLLPRVTTRGASISTAMSVAGSRTPSRPGRFFEGLVSLEGYGPAPQAGPAALSSIAPARVKPAKTAMKIRKAEVRDSDRLDM